MNGSQIDLDITQAMEDFDSLGEGRLALEKMGALMALHAVVRAYRQEGFSEEKIIRPIILKKIEFIKEAESQAQIRNILKPAKVRYIGGEILPIGPYAISEEELAMWSRTSVMAGRPLIAPAVKRYRELFQQIFPDLTERLEL